MLDPVWLRTFLEVADSGGFSRAARALGLGQPAVSQHVRKLEAAVGRSLLVRDSHTVELTGDGEAMVGFARGILGRQQQALDYFAGPEPSGRVRLGVSEDLVSDWFSQIAQRFQRMHPRVDLDLTAGLSTPLHDRLERGELDMALIKQPGSEPSGRLLWRDELVWVGTPDTRIVPGDPVPLVVYPEPSITRARALSALERAQRSWRVSCTADRLNGLSMAVRAGLGVAVFARSVVPDGLVPVRGGLPALDQIEFVLSGRIPVRGTPMSALVDMIAAAGRPEVADAHPEIAPPRPEVADAH
ncbi:LysR family transcriptional regulator [Saccharopolyspora sp. 6M]|uniref:LysR family transcriptional regulator n=1 Tax=Saccharopolyspora sp. 6M TaxID=2877237 RepID=UPI001CD5A2DD|nr:LysR family transcriptional regulator [Saccharopolyspora sp. 6M]MCA1228147.1 LysR family transcriptional regulator [Saccharopolyspora sp. 6M]